MVPCHSCYIYTTWRSKEVGSRGVLKSSDGGGQAKKAVRGNFCGGLTTLDTMGLSNYCYVFNTILTRKIHHNILYFVNAI